MNTTDKTTITVEANVQAPIEKVWAMYTAPEHIMQWNNASDDWHTTAATNDLRPGGKFNSHMAAKDGSMGFDFWGIYDEVKTHDKIAYTLGDERKVEVLFSNQGNGTKVIVHFEAETENSIELQQDGWQAILNNFKAHVELQQ